MFCFALLMNNVQLGKYIFGSCVANIRNSYIENSIIRIVNESLCLHMKSFIIKWRINRLTTSHVRLVIHIFITACITYTCNICYKKQKQTKENLFCIAYIYCFLTFVIHRVKFWTIHGSPYFEPVVRKAKECFQIFP